ncbi:MAG: hypothetical protein QW707_08290 [Candidatus Bathyarchaeia archaeon]
MPVMRKTLFGMLYVSGIDEALCEVSAYMYSGQETKPIVLRYADTVDLSRAWHSLRRKCFT